MKSLRPDLVFSYWIYAWYIIYVFNFFPFPPKFPQPVGFIDNIVMLCLMFMYGTSPRTIYYFIIINTVIKVVPLYFLQEEVVKMKDIYFTIGLFIVFIIWLQINKQSLIGNIKLVHDSLLYGQNKTPFMSFINKVKLNFKELQIL